MKKAVLLAFAAALLPSAFAQAPTAVTPYGEADSSILSGVAVPAGYAQMWVSGTVPSVTNEAAPDGSVEQYGDMTTQASSVFDNISGVLEEAGLGLEDVVYLRVYLVPDPESREVDYDGFFEAYGQYFNNEENPVKTARSTIAVAGLVLPGWLVEIDALAVYPTNE